MTRTLPEGTFTIVDWLYATEPGIVLWTPGGAIDVDDKGILTVLTNRPVYPQEWKEDL